MAPSTSPDPRRQLGARGEEIAAAHLQRAGYTMLARNWRCRNGELDIVAYDERALVFCEVKTRRHGGRSGPAGALDAIGPAKRRRLRQLASAWMASADGAPPRPSRRDIRFDAIGVTLDAREELVALDHVQDAF